MCETVKECLASLRIKGSMCKSLVKEIASKQFISWWEIRKENGHGREEICWSINKHVATGYSI